MGCKGCKSKNAMEFNKDEPPKKLGNSYVWVITVFTSLAVYGVISLIFDIKNLFN
tara:strand:- start:224 stop:388 length:165 start_codon:yes stop_codon:yes gene_type:complete